MMLRKKVLKRGKQFYQYSLIGHLDLGNISLLRARSIAMEIWNPNGYWRLIPLGNGFFMLKLDSRDDFMRIWSQTWKLGNLLIRFLKQSPDFDK